MNRVEQVYYCNGATVSTFSNPNNMPISFMGYNVAANGRSNATTASVPNGCS